MFGRDVIHAIKRHAIEAWPEECCGVVVGDAYVRCRNVHAKPTEDFQIGQDEWDAAYAAGTVEAVVHSHPDAPESRAKNYPTVPDMEQQIATALPWGITCTDGAAATEPFWFGDQAPIPALIGRGFRHGVTDCLSLIRDAYRLPRDDAAAQLEIEDWPFDQVIIPEFPREWEWWLEEGDKNPNFYRDCFDAAGFVEIGDAPRPGDIFRMSLRAATPNHAGIYLSGNLGVHHLASTLPVDHKRLSGRIALGSYRNLITEHRWLRFKG